MLMAYPTIWYGTNYELVVAIFFADTVLIANIYKIRMFHLIT